MAAGALPVGAQLERRGLQLDTSCRRCQAQETTAHVFMECPFAREVWRDAGISLPPWPDDTSIKGFLTLGEKCKATPPSTCEVNPFPWLIWHLWTARNNLIFETRGFTPQEVIAKAGLDAKAWDAANQLKKKNKKPPSPQSENGSARTQEMEPSPLDYSCFVDASWISDTKTCGMGWVIRAREGEERAHGESAERWTGSALEAEAKAVRAALRDAHEKGIQEIHIYSDSQSLIKSLNGSPLSEIVAIVRDIFDLRSSFLRVEFSFIPRSLNVEADTIAKQALRGLLVTSV